MGAVAPLVWLFTGLYDIISGVVGLIQGKGFKDAFSFSASKNFTKQMHSKLAGNQNLSETKLASGGIVRSPTRALIGEAGPEAVIPLNSGFLRENNINYNPTIHINASISNDMDIENVAKKVNELLYSELRGVSIR